MNSLIIRNAQLVNEGSTRKGHLLVEEGTISDISYGPLPDNWPVRTLPVTDAQGKYLLPGIIDDQVHFREPGLTHKGDMASESAAAAAGGVTSYMEMPNTNPQTTNQEQLEAKYALAAQKSVVNYSVYIGATNDNLEELRQTDFSRTCGIKVFMGSSTGNMLVDNEETLAGIFREKLALVAIHSEYEPIIREEYARHLEKYGEDIPIACHPAIRNARACYESTRRAVDLARKYGTRLHVLHLSTADEMEFFEPGPVEDKNITAEVCVHHLWFSDADYARYGARIKWNPAIKRAADREALLTALADGRIDVIATDHAPHTLKEKSNLYPSCPSGGPLVQHSLQAMLEFWHDKRMSMESIVEKMCHNPARLFRIEKRGFIRKGYKADLVLVDPGKNYTVNTNNILYKCGWSPFEGQTFRTTIETTWVNGQPAFTDGKVGSGIRGERLLFSH